MTISLVATFYLVMRAQAVQTLLVQLAADYLSRELRTDIRIRGFDLSIRNGLLINGITALDHKGDTLLSANSIGVRPGIISITGRKINISRVTVNKATFQLLTHKGDSTSNLQYILDHFASAEPSPPDTTPARPWDLSVSSIKIEDTRFHLQDQNEPPALQGMDYTNLDVTGIDLEITDLVLNGDTIDASIKKLNASERSGINLHNLSGDFRVGPRFLKAHDLHITTDRSELSLTFDFLYDEWFAFNDFLNKVRIIAKIEPSTLDLSDIGFFAPELAVMRDRVKVSGDIRGTVTNFTARNFKLAYGPNTFFHGNISATGLPDVEKTFMDLEIFSLATSKTDIESLLLPIDEEHIKLPPLLEGLGVISLGGRFTGFYNDFSASLRLFTEIGNASTDLTMHRPQDGKLHAYQGQFRLQGFDVGILTGNSDLLGKVTLSAGLKGEGFSMANGNVTMDVRIDTVHLNHYAYHNINVSGILNENVFNGKLDITDRNLDLKFDGIVNMQDSLPDYDFTLLINKANLFNLNLLKRDSVTDLEAHMNVRLKGSNLDNIDGSAEIRNLVYSEGDQAISMTQLALLTSQDTATGKSYHLQSDYVDADISGNFTFGSLIPSLTDFIRNYLASFNKNDTNITQFHAISDVTMNYKIRIKESKEVTSMFLPFLEIAPGTTFDGFYNEKTERIVLRGQSPAVFINNIELTNWTLDAENRLDDLSLRTGAEHVYLKRATKTDSVEVKVDSFNISANLRHDSLLYKIDWLTAENASKLNGFADFSDPLGIRIRLLELNAYLNQKYWSVDPENYTVIDTSSVLFHDLSFSSGEQFLKIDGILSDRKSDTLGVSFNRVDISRLDELVGQFPLDVDGFLSGNLKISDAFNEISVVSDLRISKFRFNRETLGDVNFNIVYNANANRFDLLSQIIYTGNMGSSIPFSLKGSFYLDKKNPYFDFDLVLKNLNLKMAAPFVEDFMTIKSGLASGNISIKGTLDKPDVNGQINLMRTEFKINYLNVPYSFADVVTINNNAFLFENITLFDTLNHKAILNGKISHNHFSDIRLDLNIAMVDFAAFNNNRSQNNVFFGKARASGDVSITGPPDDIKILVRANNGGQTHVVIPIDLTRSIGHSDYMIFVEPESDSLERNSEKQELNTKGISLDLGLRINQNAVVEVYFPEQLGNLKATGSGNLLMTMTPSTPFQLSGIYSLAKGSFLFQFRNLLRLPMSIKEGSTISWTGDAADANVSISTVYRTKAPLKGLTTNTELEGVRIPVECIVRLGGKLMNPEISFAINLPNVEEGIKNLVYSAIDTNNPVTITEQTIYLMVMNQFKPVVASSSAVDVGATSMSLVTNQINSMLSQITTNVNVNMNYKPGSSTTQQEFDVGISTQLFDDRLLIDGTFGMNSYTNSTVEQSSTIVGDINIEYILTKNRRWRVRAFNRTNTLNILNNNSQYTQGVGIKYQRDFTNFKDLFKFSKSSKF